MPKNRDYTGLERTPASMSWLIRERARLKGELDRRRQVLERLPGEIHQLEQQLASLDNVFPLHQVKVTPEKIKGVRPQAPPLLPHGAMTKGILNCLRQAAGKPVLTTEIALYAARSAGMELTGSIKAVLVKRVHWRLKRLREAGVVQSHHRTGPGIFDEGLWSLAPESAGAEALKAA